MTSAIFCNLAPRVFLQDVYTLTSMLRTPLIAGNWKMNSTVPEALRLASTIASAVESITSVDVAVYPPYTVLQTVSQVLADTRTEVGAQNMHFERSGAFTGEISPTMLTEFVTSVILGHSERRHIFGESDMLVASKVRSALDHNLTPVVCVGEQIEERESNRTNQVIAKQMEAVLEKITAPEASRIIVAYEPVWAIGTGKNASPEQAEEVCAFIRGLVKKDIGTPAADMIRILYGGSVNIDNWEELSQNGNIDGALVGGASLKAIDFVQLVLITENTNGHDMGSG